LPRNPVEYMHCYTCRYWNALGPAYWLKPTELGNSECRRFPPILDTEGNTVWPETAHDDWCGEWEHDVEDKKKDE